MHSKHPPCGPPLDHALLIADVAIGQAASSTALLAERMAQQPNDPDEDAPGVLIDVLVGREAGPGDTSQGSFHPRLARESVRKDRSRLMKPGFTLAF